MLSQENVVTDKVNSVGWLTPDPHDATLPLSSPSRLTSTSDTMADEAHDLENETFEGGNAGAATVFPQQVSA